MIVEIGRMIPENYHSQIQNKNMNAEFEPYPELNSRLPDFGAALAHRVAARSAEIHGTLPPAGTVDPYKMMLQRKQGIEPESTIAPTMPEWPVEQVKQLEDYCSKMGIIGFSAGRMNPLAALAMLQKQFGQDYSNIPLDERIPAGYQKMGTHSGNSPNYPFVERGGPKKQILHG